MRWRDLRLWRDSRFLTAPAPGAADGRSSMACWRHGVGRPGWSSSSRAAAAPPARRRRSRPRGRYDVALGLDADRRPVLPTDIAPTVLITSAFPCPTTSTATDRAAGDACRSRRPARDWRWSGPVAGPSRSAGSPPRRLDRLGALVRSGPRHPALHGAARAARGALAAGGALTAALAPSAALGASSRVGARPCDRRGQATMAAARAPAAGAIAACDRPRPGRPDRPLPLGPNRCSARFTGSGTRRGVTLDPSPCSGIGRPSREHRRERGWPPRRPGGGLRCCSAGGLGPTSARHDAGRRRRRRGALPQFTGPRARAAAIPRGDPPVGSWRSSTSSPGAIPTSRVPCARGGLREWAGRPAPLRLSYTSLGRGAIGPLVVVALAALAAIHWHDGSWPRSAASGDNWRALGRLCPLGALTNDSGPIILLIRTTYLALARICSYSAEKAAGRPAAGPPEP
jgi:hypothetical protein